jgi:hypothetical protein
MSTNEFALCKRMLAGTDAAHPLIPGIMIENARIHEHSNDHGQMTVHYVETRGPETYYRVALIYDYEDCIAIFGGQP